MSHIYNVHVGLDGPDDIRADLRGRVGTRHTPLLKLGDATLSFPWNDEAIVEICDEIVSAALEIRAEALARMVAAA